MLKYTAKEIADSLNDSYIKTPELVTSMFDCIGIHDFVNLARIHCLPGTGIVTPVYGEHGSVMNFTVTGCDDCEPYQHEGYHL